MSPITGLGISIFLSSVLSADSLPRICRKGTLIKYLWLVVIKNMTEVNVKECILSLRSLRNFSQMLIRPQMCQGQPQSQGLRHGQANRAACLSRPTGWRNRSLEPASFVLFSYLFYVFEQVATQASVVFFKIFQLGDHRRRRSRRLGSAGRRRRRWLLIKDEARPLVGVTAS